MPAAGHVAPALIRRAFFFGGALAAACAARAADLPRVAPELAQIGKPDAAEAARLIAQFRTAGIPGEYYLEFELRVLPRRGEGPVFRGRWWGTRNDRGALSRIEIDGAAGAAHRFVLQNGDGAAVWSLVGGRVTPLDPRAQLAPLLPGVEVSAFDLLMPFLYWPGPTVEKITRMLGRPAHEFLFRAPALFAADQGGIAAVRAFLDTQYNAPVAMSVIGADGRALRSFDLLELKTIGRQTLPKVIDYRNERTRDKTRLALTGAALDLRHPSALFEPPALAQPAPPLPAAQLTRIGP